MAKIWLTYAWVDNEDQQIDHVVSELRAAGIEVGFDRAQLLAGVRLWDQIDKAISADDLDGWALYVTEASLRSEPCQEEIAYALDRALRSKGGDFRLIGIFPAPLDRALIPSSIAVRLFVNLRDPTWVEQIADSLSGNRRDPVQTAPLPYGFKIHQNGQQVTLEVWPRSGRWLPCYMAVPDAESALVEVAFSGPRDYPVQPLFLHDEDARGTGYTGKVIRDGITVERSAYLVLKGAPTEVVVTNNDYTARITFNR